MQCFFIFIFILITLFGYAVEMEKQKSTTWSPARNWKAKETCRCGALLFQDLIEFSFWCGMVKTRILPSVEKAEVAHFSASLPEQTWSIEDFERYKFAEYVIK